MNDEQQDMGAYEYDLVDNLWTMHGKYASDRELYWTQKENDKEWAGIYEQAEMFAESLVKGIENLRRPSDGENVNTDLLEQRRKFLGQLREEYRKRVLEFKHVPTEENLLAFRKYLLDSMSRPGESLLDLKLAWEGIEIRLTEQLFDDLNRRVFRSLQLWDLFLDETEIKPILDQYLRMVGRTYVAGFDDECIICCRAVLEAALEEFITERMCAEILGARSERYAAFERISVARKKGILSESGEKKAYAIRERGNKTIHGNPGLVIDVFESIRDNLYVIKELLRSA